MKFIKRMAALTTALLTAVLMCLPLHAQGSGMTADRITDAVYELGRQLDRERRQNQGHNPDDPDARRPDIDVSGLPPKADLRDMDGKNYVSEVKQQEPWGTCWSFGAIAVDLNRTGILLYKQEKLYHYAETVVNPGESFAGSGDKWTDWTEIISRLEAMNTELNNNSFVYDNFPIRAYTQRE